MPGAAISQGKYRFRPSLFDVRTFTTPELSAVISSGVPSTAWHPTNEAW